MIETGDFKIVEEFYNWRSQFVISNSDKIGLRRPPYVFTEQGACYNFKN